MSHIKPAGLLAACLALLLPEVAALAQPLEVATARRRPPPTLVIAADDGPARHLGVTRVAIEARIIGHLAETRMTLTFGNTHSRALAGDLYVPLPPDATVSGYALDVGGEMIDGVVVPKEEARRIFEAEMRKGVDPGLVEWTRGNVFKTRVFPIPANGSRTVRLAWVAPLDQIGTETFYHLPLSFEKQLSEATIRIEVVPGTGTPKLEGGQGLKLAFDTRQVAETTVRNRPLVDNLRVIVPTTDSRALVEKSQLSGFTEGHWLSIRDFAPPPSDLKPVAPKRLAVLWDASLSRADADHEREIKLLSSWLRSIGTCEVDVTVFRNDADAPKRFQAPRDIEAIGTWLRNVVYDGGTQLGSITPPGGPAWADAIVIFSDGISTFGEEKVGNLGAPAWFVNTGKVAASAALTALAAANGGAYLDLPRMADDAALAALGRPAWSLLSAEIVSGRVDALLPADPAPALGPVHVVGRLMSDSAEIRLRWGIPGQSHRVERTHRVSVPAAAPVGETLRFAWAQTQLASLLPTPDKNAEALVALGRAHRIVTPGTSLLVLETLEQYLTWNVEPPATWQTMHASWHKAVKSRLEVATAEKKTRLDQVAQAWKDEIEWYNKDFKPVHKIAAEKKEEGSIGGLGMRGSGSGGGGSGEGVGRGAMRPAPRAASMASEAVADEAPRDRREQAKKSDKADPGDAGPAAEIAIAKWDPDVPWLKALKAAAPSDREKVYLAQRAIHRAAPSFFIDIAEFYFNLGDQRTGIRVLSNLAEMRLDEPALLRVMGHRLAQLNRLDLAVMIFEQVLRLRGEEPQSYRDLGLVLGRRSLEDKTGAADLERALSLLAEVIKRRWDRFDGIEIIALHEFNRLVSLGNLGKSPVLPLDERFVKSMPLDIRISMAWDADMTDMDIHVIEPSGEHAYYSHNLTQIGGRVSRDFTQGYGPETYSIKRAMKGAYKVRTKYFGSQAAQLTGGVTLQVDIVTNWGRPNETRRSLSLRLTESKEEFDVGEIVF